MSRSKRRYSIRKRHNKTRRTRHSRNMGRGPTTLQSSKKSAKKLATLLAEDPRITSGVSTTILPTAIKVAKLAIQTAHANPDDSYAREDAENKIKIADYWAARTHSRRDWRFESRIQANYDNGHDWYERKPTIQWDL